MQMPKIPSTFIAVIATVWLVQPGAGAPATSQCLAGPGAPSPRGQHWFYRVDRANNRHCWYLGAAGTPIHAHAASRPAESDAMALPALPPMPLPQATAALPPASPATPMPTVDAADSQTQLSPAAAPPANRFTTRWPELPTAVNLAALKFSQASNGYAETPVASDAEPQPAPRWPVLEAATAPPQVTPQAPPTAKTAASPVSIALGIASLVFAACGIGLGLSAAYRPA